MASRVVRKFRARNGKVFKKVFKSLRTAKNAVAGWKAAGGRMATSRKRKTRKRYA